MDPATIERGRVLCSKSLDSIVLRSQQKTFSCAAVSSSLRKLLTPTPTRRVTLSFFHSSPLEPYPPRGIERRLALEQLSGEGCSNGLKKRPATRSSLGRFRFSRGWLSARLGLLARSSAQTEAHYRLLRNSRIFSQPPLTAGTIEISDPAVTGLARPPVYRTFSSPMKILTCSRTCPCSVVMRSRTPG